MHFDRVLFDQQTGNIRVSTLQLWGKIFQEPSIFHVFFSKCSEQWLQHAIHCGDIGRIIEPLLITMLNPASRRVSVHFASVWDASTRDGEADAVSQDLLSDSENDQLYQSGSAAY